MTRRPERGMTILEVLMATMLLGIIGVIVFGAFAIGLRAAALAGGMNTATGLAEEALARLVASPCGSSFQTPIAPQPDDPRLARYRREVQARHLPGTNLWEFTATVSWTQERQQRSVTLTTYRHVSAACEFPGQ